MNVCLLGTASGLPAHDRFGQTTVLTINEDTTQPAHILLDAGDGASSLLLRHGYDHRAIQAIVISHMHADHHGGFAQVVKTCMHLQRTADLDVLAPAEGIPALQAYLEASYLTPPMLGFDIQWQALSDVVEEPITLSNDVVVHAFLNDHLASARRQFAKFGITEHGRTFESYSFALEFESARIVYSGNLNGPGGADEMEPYLEPCDLLICELAHVDPGELGRLLAGKDVKQVVLAHFHPKWEDVSDEEILNRIHQGAGDKSQVGPIVLAQDEEVIRVRLPSQAGVA